MELLSNPEFWVGVSFLGFVALILYYGVPRLIGKSLDERAAGIRKELDEAKRLKDEAQALLNDYRRRKDEASKEADAIIAQAKSEALAIAAETRASMKEMVERRTRLAEEKIARAEAQAVGEVRAAAIDAAVSASERLIGTKLDAANANTLIDQGIRELKKKLG
jgi:F-type H+-transporting ATPase subunit b